MFTSKCVFSTVISTTTTNDTTTAAIVTSDTSYNVNNITIATIIITTATITIGAIAISVIINAATATATNTTTCTIIDSLITDDIVADTNPNMITTNTTHIFATVISKVVTWVRKYPLCHKSPFQFCP